VSYVSTLIEEIRQAQNQFDSIFARARRSSEAHALLWRSPPAISLTSSLTFPPPQIYPVITHLSSPIDDACTQRQHIISLHKTLDQGTPPPKPSTSGVSVPVWKVKPWAPLPPNPGELFTFLTLNPSFMKLTHQMANVVRDFRAFLKRWNGFTIVVSVIDAGYALIDYIVSLSYKKEDDRTVPNVLGYAGVVFLAYAFADMGVRFAALLVVYGGWRNVWTGREESFKKIVFVIRWVAPFVSLTVWIVGVVYVSKHPAIIVVGYLLAVVGQLSSALDASMFSRWEFLHGTADHREEAIELENLGAENV
jgi:hypothetical protein